MELTYIPVNPSSGRNISIMDNEKITD